MRLASSRTVFAIGPPGSAKYEIGISPFCDIRPVVGLIVERAALETAEIKDAAVSVPLDTGAQPALAPMAGPEEESPGFCEQMNQQSRNLFLHMAPNDVPTG